MAKIKISDNRCNRCGAHQLVATTLCPKCAQSFQQEDNGKPITKKE